jgi:hypothetical protein
VDATLSPSIDYTPYGIFGGGDEFPMQFVFTFRFDYFITHSVIVDVSNFPPNEFQVFFFFQFFSPSSSFFFFFFFFLFSFFLFFLSRH